MGPRLLDVLPYEGRVELQLVQPHVLQRETRFAADCVVVDPKRFDGGDGGELFGRFERGSASWKRSQARQIDELPVR